MPRPPRAVARPAPVAILALRTPGTGKTRFASLGRRQRADLALAMVLDAVRALRGVAAEVIIVTGLLEPRERQRLQDAGCHIQTEPPEGDGLNAALAAGIAALPPDTLVLAGVGDLPSLTPDSVRFVAQEARSGPVIVPDADGVGTTMIAGPAGLLRPCFGADSALRHRALGLRVLADAPAAVRRDADDVAALTAAVRLGVGPATAALLAASRWWTRQVPAEASAGTCH